LGTKPHLGKQFFAQQKLAGIGISSFADKLNISLSFFVTAFSQFIINCKGMAKNADSIEKSFFGLLQDLMMLKMYV
jgi:hypothetical protein